MKLSSIKFLIVIVAGLAIAAPSSAQLCGVDWAPTAMEITPNGLVLAMAVWDDGTGPKLFIGGSFTGVNGVTGGAYICKWNGTAFSDVGGGMIGGQVTSLCVHDDGSGPALFAGGWFTGPGSPGIAKWNGTTWSPVGTGLGSSGVSTIASYDDGTGSALYASGWFTQDGAGAVVLNHIAKWQAGVWSPIGTGLNSGSTTSIVYNGSLYTTGAFTSANGIASPHIVRYNGAGFSAVGTGTNGSTDINALAIFDPGTGPKMYAGGSFTSINGVAASKLAVYDGTNWAPIGTGLPSGLCFGLATYDDGTGNALYAIGSFTTVDGVPANRIAKYNGATWSALGAGITAIAGRCLQSYSSPFGAQLFVGGGFSIVGTGVTSPNLATWGPTPPYIITQPASLAVNHGQPATFTVVAGGLGLNYQWRKYFSPIAGATSASYTIPVTQPLDWALYDCVVGNGCGLVTTATAQLTLNPGIILTVNQPFGSQSFYVQHQAAGQGGLGYFTHFSFDILNTTNPNQGPFWGCWSNLNDIVNQYLLGFAPFQGTLDGGGNAVFALGPGAVPFYLVGQTVTAVSCTYTPSLQLVSNSNTVQLTIF